MKNYDIQPGQTWAIDSMRPEDAEGVARLFLDVYGEGYPVRTFIDPRQLIEENQAKRVLSSVARTPRGDIVGHNALFHSAPSDKIYESGAGLVHRHYRGGKGIFGQMNAHCHKTASKSGADAVWGEPVSNHVFSQKMSHSQGWRTCALEVNLMPAAAYAKEASAQGRVSTFMDFFEFNLQPQRVYLPEAYEAELKVMYGDFLELRKISLCGAAPPEGASTEIAYQFFDFAKVLRATVTRIGADFAAALSSREAMALDRGYRVIQVWLKLSDPAVGWAVNALRSQGYFLGGPLPRWFGGDGFLMQKVLDKPQWELIQIVDERNRELVNLVKRDWQVVAP